MNELEPHWAAFPKALIIKVQFPGTVSDLIHWLHLNCTYEVISYGDWKCFPGISIQWLSQHTLSQALFSLLTPLGKM